MSFFKYNVGAAKGWTLRPNMTDCGSRFLRTINLGGGIYQGPRATPVMCEAIYSWNSTRGNRTHRAASGRNTSLLQHQIFRPDAARCVRFSRWNSSLRKVCHPRKGRLKHLELTLRFVWLTAALLFNGDQI